MNKSIEQVVAEVKVLRAGLPAYCALMTFIVDGKTYTCSDFEAVCDGFIGANTTVNQARAALDKAVMSQRQAFETELPIITHVRTVLAGAFSSDLVVQAALGVALRRKPAALTTEERLTKSEKAKATRKARGTTSKKQKSKIFGSVTGATVKPVVEGDPT